MSSNKKKINTITKPWDIRLLKTKTKTKYMTVCYMYTTRHSFGVWTYCTYKNVFHKCL